MCKNQPNPTHMGWTEISSLHFMLTAAQGWPFGMVVPIANLNVFVMHNTNFTQYEGFLLN